MIIGVDIRPLQGETKYRGIGKALGRVLPHLLKFGDEKGDKFVLFYDPDISNPNFITPEGTEFDTVKTLSVYKKRFVSVVFKPYKAINPRPGRVDVLLQFDFALGIPKNTPTIAMFHDLIPILFREQDLVGKKPSKNPALRIRRYIGDKLQWRRYVKSLRSYENAAKILAISKSSRKDLLKYMPKIKTNKVKTVYLGVDPLIKNDSLKIKNSTIINDVINSQYLLYVGGIDTRKNIVQLVKDFYELKSTHANLKLVLVGKEFTLKENLSMLGWFDAINENQQFKKDVVAIGYVDDDLLNSLYENALVFVFPSLYEGFGLPVLEAMSKGCPTVAYNVSSIPEVSGDAAVLANPKEGMAKYIEKLINDKDFRKKIITRGYERVKIFPWSKTAMSILKEMHSIKDEE